MTADDPTVPAVAAVITVNEMYQELRGVRSDVQTLVGKIDDMPRQITELQMGMRAVEGLPSDVNDHEVRLRVVEAANVNIAAIVGQLPRKAVSPQALAWAIGIALTALGVLAAFLAVQGG